MKNIFEEKELDENMVVSKMEITTQHGAIEGFPEASLEQTIRQQLASGEDAMRRSIINHFSVTNLITSYGLARF